MLRQASGLYLGFTYCSTLIECTFILENSRIAGELNAAAKIRAKQILEDAVVEAARVKVAGLKNSNARIKQDAATEILDRNGFKATQPIDLTSKGESIAPVQIIEVVKDHGK